MTDSLSARIAQKRQKVAHVHNRQAFLSLSPDIEIALKDGWSILSIWETLYDEKKITFGYQAFRRYVYQWIQQEPFVPEDNHRREPNYRKISSPARI